MAAKRMVQKQAFVQLLARCLCPSCSLPPHTDLLLPVSQRSPSPICFISSSPYSYFSSATSPPLLLSVTSFSQCLSLFPTSQIIFQFLLAVYASRSSSSSLIPVLHTFFHQITSLYTLQAKTIRLSMARLHSSTLLSPSVSSSLYTNVYPHYTFLHSCSNSNAQPILLADLNL